MSFSSALKTLQLPRLQYTVIPDLTPEQEINIQEWKASAFNSVTELLDLLAHHDLSNVADNDIAVIVAIAAPFLSEDIWTSGPMRASANDILKQLPDPTLEVITCVLSQHIKPWFVKTPHSLINPTSGRRLPRPIGGPSAALDFYEDQEWKTCPGIANLLLWCIRNLKSEDYERVWHLLIPPIMTLLDDYESFSKLKGVELSSELLDHVPPQFLQRTGIDGLLITSLKTAMLHLHSPLTPQIIRSVIPVYLKVVNLTTTSGSKARFDYLCALLGDSVIGGVWIYASREWETLEASVLALPDVLQELGIGSVRYLKVIVSQLVEYLISVPLGKQTASLQVASLMSLERVIKICYPRISGWVGLIVEGMARLWVTVQDTSPLPSEDWSELRFYLKRLSSVLSEIYPSVVQNEYQHLLKHDAYMFGSLIGQ